MQIDTTPSYNQVSENVNAIFAQNLSAGPQVQKVQSSQKKEKFKAQLILAVSFLALVSYSIFFFYGNASAYLKASSQILTLNRQVENYEKEVIPALEATKLSHKSAYDEEFKGAIGALDVVYPSKLDKLGIIQKLESFATETNSTLPPFELTSVEIGAAIPQEGSQILPITTTIHASQAGFDQFLALVEKSGAIYQDPKAEEKVLADEMVRLMTISNINIKYRGMDPKTGKDEGVDFTVKLNVYSRV